MHLHPQKLTEMNPSFSAMGKTLPGIQFILQHIDPFVHPTAEYSFITRYFLGYFMIVPIRRRSFSIPFPRAISLFLNTNTILLSPTSIPTFVLLGDHRVRSVAALVYNFKYPIPLTNHILHWCSKETRSGCRLPAILRKRSPLSFAVDDRSLFARDGR